MVAAFLADYAQSVNTANTDLDGTAALCEEQGVVAKAAIAKKALPNCNIVCLTGEELKADVSGYLQVLYDADPAAVGGSAVFVSRLQFRCKSSTIETHYRIWRENLWLALPFWSAKQHRTMALP